MKSVYVVQHSYEVPETGADEAKFIGVYTTRSSAEAAVNHLLAQPGFRDYPDGFFIDEYELDKDHWEEGFISSEEAMKG